MPQALKQCGYDTEMYGKWHVGMFHEDYQPHRRGFDHFLGFLTGGADFWTHRKCYDSVWIHNLFSNQTFVFRNRAGRGLKRDGVLGDRDQVSRGGLNFAGLHSITIDLCFVLRLKSQTEIHFIFVLEY